MEKLRLLSDAEDAENLTLLLQAELRKIDALPPASMDDKEISLARALSEEYNARFYWHYGVSQLLRFGIRSSRVDRGGNLPPSQRRGLQTAFLAFRMALSVYSPPKAPLFLRKLANERWCALSQLLLAISDTFDFKFLDLSEGASGSHQLLFLERPSDFSAFLEPPSPKSDAHPRQLTELFGVIAKRRSLETLEFTDGDFVCSNARDLRAFVLAGAWNVGNKNLWKWCQILFPYFDHKVAFSFLRC